MFSIVAFVNIFTPVLTPVAEPVVSHFELKLLGPAISMSHAETLAEQEILNTLQNTLNLLENGYLSNPGSPKLNQVASSNSSRPKTTTNLDRKSFGYFCSLYF